MGGRSQCSSPIMSDTHPHARRWALSRRSITSQPNAFKFVVLARFVYPTISFTSAAVCFLLLFLSVCLNGRVDQSHLCLLLSLVPPAMAEGSELVSFSGGHEHRLLHKLYRLSGFQ